MEEGLGGRRGGRICKHIGGIFGFIHFWLRDNVPFRSDQRRSLYPFLFSWIDVKEFFWMKRVDALGRREIDDAEHSILSCHSYYQP